MEFEYRLYHIKKLYTLRNAGHNATNIFMPFTSVVYRGVATKENRNKNGPTHIFDPHMNKRVNKYSLFLEATHLELDDPVFTVLTLPITTSDGVE
jgi:hypothetical protein